MVQQDLVLIKRRFGAFVHGSSDLHARLQERGIDTLIISGTLSQVCCEATARDAMMMNYKVFFITDACATLTDAEHGGTLSAMAHVFLRRPGYAVPAGSDRGGRKPYLITSLAPITARGNLKSEDLCGLPVGNEFGFVTT